MILQSLIKYYDRPGQDFAPIGFSLQKISFCVVLNPDGSLDAIEDMRRAPDSEGTSKKLIAQQLVVPGQSIRSSNIKPSFLWDNAAYMLGFNSDDSSDGVIVRFEAFRDWHLKLCNVVDDQAFDAVCSFLKNWNPAAFEPEASQAEYMATGFGVFRVLPAQELVHEREAIRAWWLRHEEEGSSEESSDTGETFPSLVTGRPSRIARLHKPAIKGVIGSRSGGVPLVSFNLDASNSYGKSQGMNAPVAEDEAFKYCTALNSLLNDRSRRTGIGDATVVWWTDQPEEVGEQIAALFFGAQYTEAAEDEAEPEDAAMQSRVSAAMSRIVRGLVPEDLGDSKTPFHVLGLSPNAARLSVRFWWDGTLGEIMKRLVTHHADLHLEPRPSFEVNRLFSIRRMVMETARQHGGKPDADTVSPTLSGEVTRSVLSGGPYPMSLLEAVIRRIRADGRVTFARCSITKACITRRRRILAGSAGQFEEVPVSLDPDGPVSYQLGRLFAVLEKSQEDALGDVNASIRDRYFGTASATPAVVFPRLIRLTQHHLNKLDRGHQISREKLMQEVCSHIETFPRHLNIEEQGLFQIGYYHQRQSLFTKNEKNIESAAAQEN